MDKINTFYIVKKGTNEIQWLSPSRPLLVTRDVIKEKVRAVNKFENDMTDMDNENLEQSEPYKLWLGISVRLYEEQFGILRDSSGTYVHS